MNWKKLGIVFTSADKRPEWLKSHTMMPVPLALEDRIRIYYTGRHVDGRSRISFVDVDKNDPLKILAFHPDPLLEVGRIGTFDDCGTVGTFALDNGSEVWLYYNGYNVRNTVPWSNSIGLAISRDGGTTFNKTSEGPIMDRSPVDPFFTITPGIVKQSGKWHMWYTSGTGWIPVGNRVEPLYNIKYAWSEDGVNWNRTNEVCVEQANPEECVARASVLRDGDNLHMWFIYRGSRDFRDGVDSYRIGYAAGNITQPTVWKRDDSLAGISPGPESYDSMMQAYPGIVGVGDRVYMFYNGNNFGSDGIACAVLEK
jgi:hypothetical protein